MPESGYLFSCLITCESRCKNRSRKQIDKVLLTVSRYTAFIVVLSRLAQFINHLNLFDMLIKLNSSKINRENVISEASEYLRKNNINAEITAAHPATFTKNLWYIYAH